MGADRCRPAAPPSALPSPRLASVRPCPASARDRAAMAGNNRLSYRSLIALEHPMIATHRPSIHPNLTPFALAFPLGAIHPRNLLVTEPVGGAPGPSMRSGERMGGKG